MKRLIVFIILLGLSVLLYSYSTPTSHEDVVTELKSQTPLSFSHRGQEFQVIPFYKEILDYIDAVRNQPSQNKTSLFEQSVVEPFRLNAFGEGEGYEIVNYMGFTPPKNINKLEKSIYLLVENQERVNELITEALKKSAEKLPGRNKLVYFLPYNPDNTYGIQQMQGVAGFALSKDVILI
jgi:hypothetical protein